MVSAAAWGEQRSGVETRAAAILRGDAVRGGCELEGAPGGYSGFYIHPQQLGQPNFVFVKKK